MSSRILSVYLSLFTLLYFCITTVSADYFFYKMQITIAERSSVFYIRSENILESKNSSLLDMGMLGHIVVWDYNPSPGFGTAVSKWNALPRFYPPVPETISGTFSTSSEEQGNYLLTPLQTLPPDVTESIEVNNESYQLLPNILHQLSKQAYGRAQEYSWLSSWRWLIRCSFLFGVSEDSSQGASSSGNTGQVVTEQPHSSQQPSNEWRLTWVINGSTQQPLQQQSALDLLLSTIALPSAMELVSLTGSETPSILLGASGWHYTLIFRTYLPNSVEDYNQARSTLGLSNTRDLPAILREVSLQSSDAKNKSEELE